MTGEEREKALETLKNEWGFEVISNDAQKALDTAIKALEQIPNLKEAYNKGYKDGQEALALHYELCKEEGNIVTVSDGTTNGDMIKAMFPNAKKHESIEYHNILFAPSCHLECCNEDWWNSPYRKEQE